MHAFYEFELVRGEDRSIPMTFWYRDPETGDNEVVKLTDYGFLMLIKDKHTQKELARLSTEDDSILLGEMVDRVFVEAGDDKEATTLLINITHEMTQAFDCQKAIFDLFLLSGDIRQCVMTGVIRVKRGCTYG